MYLDANDELEEIDAWCRHLPEVLEVRVGIYTALEKWELLEAVSRKLAEVDLKNPKWFLAWALATRHVSSVEAARLVLLAGLEHHPMDAELLFNLARYCCGVGDVSGAKEHLKRCFLVDPTLRMVALEDPELERVWVEAG